MEIKRFIRGVVESTGKGKLCVEVSIGDGTKSVS